jgi:hypothetical protein
MNAPAIVIRLELEAAPRIVCDYLLEEEEVRMLDWLRAHPAQEDLVTRALEIARMERAA